MFAGVADHALSHLGAGDDRRGGAEFLGQIQGRQNPLAPSGVQPLQRRRLHVDRMPFGVQLAGEPRGGAHHSFGARIRTDTRQKRRRGLPDRADRFVDAIGLNVTLDAVGGTAQRQFAQRHEIPLAEKILGGAFRLLGDVHLAGFQARQHLLGRNVDQHHLVGRVEDRIRYGLPHADIGDAADDVIETVEMLHVQRREYVDPGREQLIDILPAFRMA